jgi:hypothetical protein
MAATIRITCTHSAPKGWDWMNELNKGFRHPTALLDGEKKELRWDAPTDIPVSPGKPHTLQVYMSIFGLHWCATETMTITLTEGETQSYEYHLELKDRYVNRGLLNRV